MESAQSHSVFSSGGIIVLCPCCLSYWPLGERGTEHLCWIEGTA